LKPSGIDQPGEVKNWLEAELTSERAADLELTCPDPLIRCRSDAASIGMDGGRRSSISCAVLGSSVARQAERSGAAAAAAAAAEFVFAASLCAD